MPVQELKFPPGHFDDVWGNGFTRKGNVQVKPHILTVEAKKKEGTKDAALWNTTGDI